SDGVLHIVVEKGQAVPVGQMIGRIGGEAPARPAEAPAAGGPASEEPASEGPADAATDPAEPAPAAEAEPAPAESAPAESPASPRRAPEPEPEPERRPAEPAPRRGTSNGAARVKASPIARRLADELGVDLAAVQGSGPEGRVVKEDVLAAAERSGSRAAATAVRSRPSGPDVETVEP